jgi:hypothetical protein
LLGGLVQIQIDLARQPGYPERWVALFRVRGDLRRTFFDSLDHVKAEAMAAIALAYEGQAPVYRFAEVDYGSLPFEHRRSL